MHENAMESVYVFYILTTFTQRLNFISIIISTYAPSKTIIAKWIIHHSNDIMHIIKEKFWF